MTTSIKNKLKTIKDGKQNVTAVIMYVGKINKNVIHWHIINKLPLSVYKDVNKNYL